MKLTRGKRIALELLGPALLGGMLLGPTTTLYMLKGRLGEDRPGELLWTVFLYTAAAVGFGYLFAGIQSIIYACVMEWRFARGLDPSSWRSVALSSMLGLASGAVIAVTYGFQRTDLLFLWTGIGGTGIVVGFIIGLLIKVWSTEKKTTGENPP